MGISNVAELHILKKIEKLIVEPLQRVGLLFTILSRVKSIESLESKLKKKREIYEAEKRKLQDYFGVRVTLYFADDVMIAEKAVQSAFGPSLSSSQIDVPDEATFGPTRCNFIFRLSRDLCERSPTLLREDLVDDTVEVQFRTVLSEGWHEVEHDLRYKCLEDWTGHHDLFRALNGVVATLETCDWSMLHLFDDLAYRHYKQRNWSAMIRFKFRLRFQTNDLPIKLQKCLDNDIESAKKLFRTDRKKFMTRLLVNQIQVPIIPANIIFMLNNMFVDNPAINNLMPQPIRLALEI